jgi:nucleoside-triphosphatase THEP1
VKIKNILLTGSPGCGKSTLIEKVVAGTKRPATGFLTREIREHNRRVGFSINPLNGNSGVLAHENIESKFKVGKYGVNIKGIDSIAVPAMVPDNEKVLVIIDEIGKMECLSGLFRDTVKGVLNSKNPVLGSIALSGGPFITKIKRRDDILIVEVTKDNRDTLVGRFI